MELKFKQFIKEKGINENNLPTAIRNMIVTVTNIHRGKTINKNKPDFNAEKVKSDFAEVDNSLIELLKVYLENPDMNLDELMQDDNFGESFEEAKKEVEEIKIQVATPTPTPTPTKNSKEDILGQLYTAGQTKVKAETLKGAGYPMGFFDDIYAGTGKYKLKKSLSGLYEISLK